MAKLDQDNRAKFWVDPHLGGVSLLRAAFRTLSFAPHVHNELVIAVTERGAGRCLTRGVADVGTPRTIMVFNPGEPHSGGVAGEAGWYYRGLYVSRQVLAQLCASIEARPGAVPYFRSSVLDDGELADLLVQAHVALEDGEPRIAAETHFLSAVAALFARHGDPRPRLPAVGREKSPVARAVEYMRENFDCDLAVADLADRAALSPFHFVRSFRKVTGLPPHAYLTQLRLNRARRLLAEEKAPTDVALAVGFYDQSHLIKHFKRAYGITPGQYAAALH